MIFKWKQVLIHDEKYLVIFMLKISLFVVNLGI